MSLSDLLKNFNLQFRSAEDPELKALLDRLKRADHYERLGVPSTASPEEIKKAYRKKAKEYHPDKDPFAVEVMKLVNEANDILSDPDKRRGYDRYRPSAQDRPRSQGYQQPPRESAPRQPPRQDPPRPRQEPPRYDPHSAPHRGSRSEADRDIWTIINEGLRDAERRRAEAEERVRNIQRGIDERTRQRAQDIEDRVQGRTRRSRSQPVYEMGETRLYSDFPTARFVIFGGRDVRLFPNSNLLVNGTVSSFKNNGLMVNLEGFEGGLGVPYGFNVAGKGRKIEGELAAVGGISGETIDLVLRAPVRLRVQKSALFSPSIEGMRFGWDEDVGRTAVYDPVGDQPKLSGLLEIFGDKIKLAYRK